MSARDELFEIIMRDGASSGGDAVWTNDLLDNFAHELAEQIRTASLGHYPSGACPAVTTSRGAANLIDPHVETPEYITAAIARGQKSWEGERP